MNPVRCVITAWPLPALLAWAAAWAAWIALQRAGAGAGPALAVAFAVGAAAAAPMPSWWRRLIVAAGFPLSALIAGLAPALPGWAWGALLLPLAAVYPLRAWRDAPMFPTPPRALDGLERVIALPPAARVIDAGCGLGHGLQALRRVFPQARLEGVEWSPLLARVAAWRCRFATVRRGDLWADDWSGADLVYLFQRPESMPRAAAKARAEMRRGTWLVSLAFAVPGWREHARLGGDGARSVRVYRVS